MAPSDFEADEIDPALWGRIDELTASGAIVLDEVAVKARWLAWAQ